MEAEAEFIIMNEKLKMIFIQYFFSYWMLCWSIEVLKYWSSEVASQFPQTFFPNSFLI